MSALFSVIRFCDTETTGFPPKAEMVEIGWTDLRLYPNGWAIEVDQQSAFVNPGHPIPAGATAIHGITDQMVADGMTPEAARAQLLKGADYHAAHNAPFDRQFIRSGLPWICTLACARHIWPKATNHKNETLRQYLGIEVAGDAHRAGYDAAVSARILLQLFKHMTLDEMLVVSQPEHVPARMPFGAHKGKAFSEIPDGYVRWLSTEQKMPKGIRTAALNEISRRAPVAPVPSPIIRSNSDWDRGF